MCSRRQLLSFSKALCVCQSRICSVSLFTVVCQRKIGNKKEREKEKTRKQTYQRHIRAKVDHVTDCPRYITSGMHTVCAMVWLRVKHAESAFRGGRLPALWVASTAYASLPGGKTLFEEGVFTSVLAAPATLPLRRSSGCARRWIRWRELRRAIPYLLPFPSDPAPAFWDRKPAPRFFPPEKGLDAPSVLFRGGGQGGCRWIFTKRTFAQACCE